MSNLQIIEAQHNIIAAQNEIIKAQAEALAQVGAMVMEEERAAIGEQLRSLLGSGEAPDFLDEEEAT